MDFQCYTSFMIKQKEQKKKKEEGKKAKATDETRLSIDAIKRKWESCN